MKYLLGFLIATSITVSGQIDVNGIWKDSAGTSFDKGTMIIAQKGDSIILTHYLEFNGQPFTEYGVGKIKGDSLIYHLTVTLPIPGWSLTGVHKLKLSKHGNKLIGIYIDDKGNSGRLVFTRFAPLKMEDK
jgi:hypothetical protein